MFRRRIAFAAAGLAALLIAPAASARQQQGETPAVPPVAPPPSPALTPGDAADAAPPVTSSAVDLVFAIDCSGSMSMQMERAKQAVRLIADEFRRSNSGATLRLGLIRYGNGNTSYFVQPLTPDAETFAASLDGTLPNMGAAEFFGSAIKVALNRAGWNREDGVQRHIVMVGNETATQGPEMEMYTRVIPEAAKQGVAVSALYCPLSSQRSASPSALTFRQQGGRRVFVRDLREGANLAALPDPRVVLGELSLKATWVDAARLGGGRFLQLMWDADRPVFASWAPAEFAELVAYVRSPEFNRMAQASAAELEAMLSGRYFGPATGSGSGFAGGARMGAGAGRGGVRR